MVSVVVSTLEKNKAECRVGKGSGDTALSRASYSATWDLSAHREVHLDITCLLKCHPGSGSD